MNGGDVNMRSIEFEGRDIEGKGSSGNDFVTPEADMFEGDVAQIEEDVNKVLGELGPEETGNIKRQNNRILEEDLGDSSSTLLLFRLGVAAGVLAGTVACTSPTLSVVGAVSEGESISVAGKSETEEQGESITIESPADGSSITFKPTEEIEASEVPEPPKTDETQEAILRAEVIEAANNTWEYTELNNYLKDYGTGWGQGVEGLIAQLDRKGWESPFRYFFIKDDRAESGYLSSIAAYQATPIPLDVKNSPNPSPSMLNERWVSNLVESIYIDLWVWEGNKRDGAWEQIPNKYTTFMYMGTDVDSEGNEYDTMFLNLGGFFDIDENGNVEYIPLDEAKERNFSPEIMELIKQGYTMFLHTEDGRVIGRSNFKDFQNKVLLTDQTEVEITE